MHRSSLKRVPNAKAGRDSFDLSIYGMDGVPIELIKYKLAEKVEQKKRKLIKEHKMEGGIEEKFEKKNLNYLDIKEQKEQKDKDIRDLLLKTSEQGGEGFYHNPDSINLTLKQNQMKSMFININRPQNNVNNVNNNSSNLFVNNKEEKKNKKENKKIKENIKDKEDKKDDNEQPGILSLEQFNKELD